MNFWCNVKLNIIFGLIVIVISRYHWCMKSILTQKNQLQFMMEQKHRNLALRVCIFNCLLILTIGYTQGQSRAIGTLPLIDKGNAIVDFNENLNHTPAFDRIEKIYSNLVNARGDFRYPVPELFLLDQEAHAAYIDYATNHIILEKKAYDICDRYGDPAIAFLLGHELTHYYEKHAWRSAYAKENNDLDIGKSLSEMVDGVANETEADYLGGFLAYTAGYGMFEKSDSIIQNLYKAYQLDEKMPGYPNLQDRMTLCKRSTEKLGLLVDAFDLGNNLAATGKFSLAYKVYAYILHYFQSRELYNNLGVFATINAMELFHPDSLKFKYVSELDIKFQGSRNTDVPIKTQINNILDQAIGHFNAAINLDPNYVPAYLNKANAYALKREWSKALYYLNEEALPKAIASPEKYKKTLEDIKILQAIIEFYSGNVDVAKTKLESMSNTNPLAKLNLSALNGEKINKSILKKVKNSSDQIDGMTLDSFFNDRTFDVGKVVEITNDIVFFQNKPIRKGYAIFFLDDMSDKRKKNRFAFISTVNGYQGATQKGISLDDDRKKVIEMYGEPVSEIETTEGQILAYEDIFFIIDKSKVKKWTLVGINRFR